GRGGGMLELDSPSGVAHRGHLVPEQYVAAAFADLGGERPCDRREVGDPRVRRVEGGEPPGMRLELRDLLRAQAPQALGAVCAAAALELVQPGQLALVEGDDQLAAALGGDAVALAEGVHPPRAVDAEPGLQGP